MAQHIIVTEYNPLWADMFETEAAKITAVLGKNCSAVHHIGSTAVAGLAAKPIIDIMPIVYSIDVDIFDTPQYDELIKPISAFMWVDENTVPSVIAYGAHDRVCPFGNAAHLVNALKENGVDYQYFEMPYSGHGLQNDNKIYEQYMNAVEEYLDKYMPVAE